jgi:Zn-dependent M16 (insulinase) family peptidase
MSIPELTMAEGDKICGFAARAVTPVPEVSANAYELVHLKSGARVVHLHCNDPENLFSVSFPTPPADDTGVPHILEHSVLAGSELFPVKEPFFEMVKISMATFINAMTGWDCTYYPVSSNVKRDLFNLATVYVDAVFNPLLTSETFRREAHHLAPLEKGDPTGKLTIEGIVYSEMKGAFSDPRALLYRTVARALFPDTVYGNESGGDPDAIPDLTHEQLKSFHSQFYHPSNSRIVLYGDIPTAEYLEFLDERLSSFDRIDVPPEITRQPRWDEPRRIDDSYPVGAKESVEEKTYLAMDWIIGDATDPREEVMARVLSLLLAGNEAAPLKKAIIDSHIGADLLFVGADSVGLENTFSVAIKGSEADRRAAFEELVIGTLRDIADSEIESEAIDAAFQQAAYQYRGIDSGYPLHVMNLAVHAWLYGPDPTKFMHMSECLAACRSDYAENPLMFNDLIRKQLVDNPHRVTAVLAPDREMGARTDAAFAERMATVRADLTDDEARKIAQEAEELERHCGEPNPPEALATLPQLSVSDLPAGLAHVPTGVEPLAGGVDLLCNDVFTNGINYLQVAFDLRGLPEELWSYVPRYCDAVRKLGAGDMGYEQMARRVAACTGGISCAPTFSTHAADGDKPVWQMWFSMATLDEQVEPALSVFEDVLFGVDPRDEDRMRDVIRQVVERYRTGLVHDGSGTAGRHAGRGLSAIGHLSEVVGGLPQLAATERINASFESECESLMSGIEAIREFLLAKGRVTASVTGSDRSVTLMRNSLSTWLGRMPDQDVVEVPVGFTPYADVPREGLAGPISVSHCAKVMAAPHVSHPDETLLAVASHLVSLNYMMPEIRFKGNAYGAGFRYDCLRKTLALSSFRDPHLTSTLGIFEGVTDYVKNIEWSQTEIDQAIMATAKREMQPIRPSAATGEALQRHLCGLTREFREDRYERLKRATPGEAKRAVLEVLEENMPKGAVCVVSSREKLEAANRKLGEYPLAIEDILRG